MTTWHRLAIGLGLLALFTGGCTAGLPTATAVNSVYYPALTPAKQSGDSYQGSPLLGGGGTASPSSETDNAALVRTSALYQTALGAIAWRGSELDLLDELTPLKLCDAPGARYDMALAAINRNDLWAVGRGVARFLNGQWATESTEFDAVFASSTSHETLTDVDFATGSVIAGYAVGTSGQVLQYNYLNRTWTKLTMPAEYAKAYLGAVKVLDFEDFWVAGDVVAHYKNGVWSRTPLPSGVKGPVAGMAAVSADNLWASTSSGLIQWNGSAWVLRLTPLAGHFTGAPHVSHASASVVVGASLESGVPGGLIYRMNADGQNWSPTAVALPAQLTGDSLAIVQNRYLVVDSIDGSGLWAYDLLAATWSRFAD